MATSRYITLLRNTIRIVIQWSRYDAFRDIDYFIENNTVKHTSIYCEQLKRNIINTTSKLH